MLPIALQRVRQWGRHVQDKSNLGGTTLRRMELRLEGDLSMKDMEMKAEFFDVPDSD